MTFQRIQAVREQMGEKPALPYGGQKPEWYEYPNGARLWIGGMDNPNKMLSGERDFIYINQAEELKLDDWEVLLTRCTGRGAVTKTPMIFGDCNPGAEDHWIIKRDGLRVFQSRHEDNPTLFDENGEMTEQGVRSMATLDSLTGVRKARLRYGKWVGAEGLYFEEWDEDLHTCDPLETIPADWPVWGALDYGYAHPTAFGVFTQDNDGTIFLLGEHVQHKWLVPEHCKAIRRLIERLGLTGRVKRIVAGHDCFQQRGDSEARTIADQYAAAKDPVTGELIGIKLEKANVDRVTGAKELQERLGNRELGITPRLKLYKTCTKTMSAMTRMVCDPRDPEDVLKVDADVNGEGGDDPYDMLRYGVMAKKSKALLWA